MFSFDVNGRNYQAEKLAGIAQFQVMRRISPMLPSVVPLLMEMAKLTEPGEDGEEKKLTIADYGSLAALAGPLTEQLANMSDKDAEFVVTACLSNVKIESEGKFVPFWNANAKKSMFNDMNDVSVWMPVVVQVIQENLSGFFPGRPTSPSIQAAAA